MESANGKQMCNRERIDVIAPCKRQSISEEECLVESRNQRVVVLLGDICAQMFFDAMFCGQKLDVCAKRIESAQIVPEAYLAIHQIEAQFFMHEILDFVFCCCVEHFSIIHSKFQDTICASIRCFFILIDNDSIDFRDILPIAAMLECKKAMVFVSKRESKQSQ